MQNLYSLETPCYIIDQNKMDSSYHRMESAFRSSWNGPLSIGYSVKTNHLPWILRYMMQRGAYAEVVSSDEFELAVQLGFSPDRIILNGPYKRPDTLERALIGGSIVNVDSIDELTLISELPGLRDCKVGLRVNFDVERECSGHSSMGAEPSRFGLCLENGDLESAIKACKSLDIQPNGLHMHFSTKTRSSQVFGVLARKAAYCIKQYNLIDTLEYIDIGGGFYGGTDAGRPSLEEYAKTITDELVLNPLSANPALIIEPGASLVSTPISYLTRVAATKNVRGHRIVTVDGSLLHINPFMVRRRPDYKVYCQSSRCDRTQIICGSTCMENDRIFYGDDIPELHAGDLIEINNCGSYSMCFNSCFINLPPAVYLYSLGSYTKVRDHWSVKNLIEYS